jgi:hypothetical protein
MTTPLALAACAHTTLHFTSVARTEQIHVEHRK